MLKCKKIHHYHKINHFYLRSCVLRLLHKPIIIFLRVRKQGNSNKNLLIPKKQQNAEKADGFFWESFIVHLFYERLIKTNK